MADTPPPTNPLNPLPPRSQDLILALDKFVKLDFPVEALGDDKARIQIAYEKGRRELVDELLNLLNKPGDPDGQ